MDLKEFRSKLNDLSSCEEKSRFCLTFMKEILSKTEGMRMSEFWEAKRACMEAFKGDISPIKRSLYWKEFVELTDEAKRLKEILDEQTAFSYSQIELAIVALEKEWANKEAYLEKIPKKSLPTANHLIRKKHSFYMDVEQELFLLKQLGARYQSLRNESIGTDMRMGQRNRLLKRAHQVGDAIFSRKKELIEEVSTSFMSDVTSFAESDFPSLKEKTPFKARREIQSFQELAKKLSLSRLAFTSMRKTLSALWELLQEELVGKKEVFAENQVAITQEVDTFLNNPPSDIRSLVAKGDRLVKKIGTFSLMPNVYKELMLRLKKGQDDLVEKAQQETLALEEKAKATISAHKQTLNLLIEKGAISDLPIEIKKEVSGLSLSLSDRAEFDSLFADLEELHEEKRAEQAIQEEAIDLLNELLGQKELKVAKLKRELSDFRREMESLSFDFEKAMVYRELYEAGKRRLAKSELAFSRLKSVCG